MKKRMLNILLVISMVFSSIPVNVIAEDINSSAQQTENYGEFVDGEQVISDMIEKNGLYAHPRIIMSEGKFEKLKTFIGDDSVTGILIESLRKEADRTIDLPVSEYEVPDGIRLLETSKRIQRRVATLAMAYNIFGDEKYAIRAYAELEAACNFEDWNPSHFLDTAEMSTAFALGYDWLYHWMNDEQRDFIRNNMIEKGLMQVMEDYEDKPRTRTYKWYQDYPGDNWKLVCNGSMAMAALAIGDETDARSIASEVLNYSYKEAYSFVRRAYSEKDGTYSEGLGYWDYATYYLGLYSSSLTSTTGSDYGLADFKGLRKSADFIRYMSSNTSKSFSFGDDGDSRDTGWSVLLWLGEYFNSYNIATNRLDKIEDGSYSYLDLLWIDEEKCIGSEQEVATDWGEVGASNASFRNTWDESGIVAALHAGTNNYKYHGHYDLGSFYIESNGERFFTDLGNEDYELKNRQYSYRIRPEGHNTLVINPSEKFDQKEGAECLISEFKDGDEAYAVTDLTDAYEPSGAKSVVRGLKMIKDKECVVIQDEISLVDSGEIYWFAHTKGQIEVSNDGKSAVVTVGSERMWVEIISDDGKFIAMNAESLPTSLEVPNQTDNSEYRKLAIHLTNTKDTTISVACIPLKQGETQPSWKPSMTAISDWAPQLPEEIVEIVASPTFNPTDETTFEYSQNVSITCLTEGAKIYYTTDGTMPSTSSTLYEGAITINETTTIKAFAVKDGMTDSDVVTATYIMQSSESGSGEETTPENPDTGDKDDTVVIDPENKDDNKDNNTEDNKDDNNIGDNTEDNKDDNIDDNIEDNTESDENIVVDQPQIKGDNGKMGWDAILDELDKSEERDRVIVDMNSETEVPEDIFNKIKGKDIDLVLEMDNGFIWTVNGESITDSKTVNMGVNFGSDIPAKVINELTGEFYYITVTLEHNGNFGFTAVLTVDMGKGNKGYTANLYYYNGENTEFICDDKIGSDGKAEFTFTHASEYIIVVDDNDNVETENTDKLPSGNDLNPETGRKVRFDGTILYLVAVVMVLKRIIKKS